MKIQTLVIVTLLFAGALYWLCRPEPSAPYSDLHPDSRVVAPPEVAPIPQPPQPPAQPATPALRPREELVHAVPMKIHWRLKLPHESDLTLGTFVFRNADAFNTYLGSKNQCFARWSNVDFKKQMAIVRVATYGPPATDDGVLDSVVRTPSEIVVFVKHRVSATHEAGPAVVRTFADGIAINRSELPVRFSDFDELAQP